MRRGKLFEFIRKLVPCAPLLSALIMGACALTAVRGYTPPVYEVRAEEISLGNLYSEEEGTAEPGTPDGEKTAKEQKAETKKPVKSTARKSSAAGSSSSKSASLSAGQTTASSQSSPQGSSSVPNVSEPSSYRDGTYTGTGTGYGGTTKVRVTVQGGRIAGIEVIDHHDGSQFMQKASALLSAIISGQTTNVDTVSGATYSSVGIIEAVRDALSQAKTGSGGSKKPQKTPTPTPTKKPIPTPTPTETPEPTGTPEPDAEQTPMPTETPTPSGTPEPTGTPDGELIYADGTYTGTAECEPDEFWDFDPYTLSLKVTILDDVITEIGELKGSGRDTTNAEYIQKAAKNNDSVRVPGVVTQILAKNSAEEIDAVSGASCSSRAIVKAVQNALEQAKRK